MKMHTSPYLGNRPVKTSGLIAFHALLLPLFLGLLPVRAETFDAVADTYVLYNTDTNFGANTTFLTSNDGGSLGIPKATDKWAIIRFDVSSLSGPVASASLSLEQVSGSGADFQVYGIPDLGTDENFDQSTYTYNASAYKFGGTQDGATTDGGLQKTNLTLLGGFSTTGAQSVDFSSTGLLDFVNADSNGIVTLIIYQSTQNKADRAFASSEDTLGRGPQLVLTTIPEPSAIASIAGLGALVLVMLRRRRTA